MRIAAINLEKGNRKECKNLLEEGKTTLDSMTDVDRSVHSSFYWISSQCHKARQEFTEFYKNALLYLAYTTVESLSESFKLDLAFDPSLAALLGDNIYNFGELLAHPIINSLIGTKVEWVYHMLQVFNTGNLALYQELCRVRNAALSAQPALVQNEQKLLEMINILCLIEIIFRKSVSLPLKWFTIGQCWRYERMTRGRRREHYQWNMDIFGVPKVRSEAELLQAIVLLFERLRIASSDVGIRVSSRKVLQAVLNMYSIPEHLFTEVCVIVDKAFDREGKLRAVCCGGRYDRLLSTFGSEDIPACGFGFGDASFYVDLPRRRWRRGRVRREQRGEEDNEMAGSKEIWGGGWMQKKEMGIW